LVYRTQITVAPHLGFRNAKALSTLSQETATVAENAVFCDSRRFRRQTVVDVGDYSREYGQALSNINVIYTSM